MKAPNERSGSAIIWLMNFAWSLVVITTIVGRIRAGEATWPDGVVLMVGALVCALSAFAIAALAARSSDPS